MTDISSLLAETKTVLLVDWPTRDVPDTLAWHGFTVVSNDGPDADDYNSYSLDNDEIRVAPVGSLPQQADLVYTHRPVDELPQIVETAMSIGARAVWIQSGLKSDGTKDPHGCWLPPDKSSKAREIVESAGLIYVEAPYIADAVRSGETTA